MGVGGGQNKRVKKQKRQAFLSVNKSTNSSSKCSIFTTGEASSLHLTRSTLPAMPSTKLHIQVPRQKMRDFQEPKKLTTKAIHHPQNDTSWK